MPIAGFVARRGDTGNTERVRDDISADRSLADVVGIGQSVRVDDLLRQIDEVAVLLSLPLGDGDRADGWTAQNQAAVLAGVVRLKSELASGRVGEEADYASHHLVRVLDHMGVSTGPIYDRLESLQRGLIDGGT